MSAARKGRVYPHERDVNNETPMLAANAMPSAKKQLCDAIRKDQRRRINRMLKCQKKEYHDCYCEGQHAMSADNKIDPSKYFYDHFANDINYTRLNVKFASSFLLHNKKKINGNLVSFDDACKDKDVILQGTSMSEERLPHEFYSETDEFLSLCKREVTEETQCELLISIIACTGILTKQLS